MREELAPAMCSGQNLDITLSLLADKVRRRACRRIGLPVAIVMEGNVQTILLRFAPTEEAGGVTLEYLLGSRPIGWRTHGELSDIAREVAASMAAFWRDRAVIAANAEEVRTYIQDLIDAAGPMAVDVAIERIAISQFPNDSFRNTGFDVDVKMLDDAHRFGTSRVFAAPGERFAFGMSSPVALHRRRQADLAAGEPALIDAVPASFLPEAVDGKGYVTGTPVGRQLKEAV
jgi:hypothetical protein